MSSLPQSASNERQIAVALEDLAAAPWDPTRWPSAVEAVAAACGGWCGHLIGAGADQGYLFGVEGGLPDGVFEAWAQLGGVEAAYNPRARAIFAAPDLQVIGDDDFVSPAARARNAIYQDVYRPFDVGQSLIVRTPLADGGCAIFTSMRPDSAGPPSPEDRIALSRLAPALAGAVRLQAMLESSAARLAVSVLEGLEAPAFFLDARGRVTDLSSQGARVVQEGTLLRLRQGRLEAIGDDDDRRFQAAVERLRGSTSGATELLLGKWAADGPVRARISRLPATGPFGLAWIAVTLSQRRDISVELLRDLGLTAAEGHVAAELVAARRPQDIATSRNVSLATVRTQIREIYTKLGVTNVAELADKLSRLS